VRRGLDRESGRSADFCVVAPQGEEGLGEGDEGDVVVPAGLVRSVRVTLARSILRRVGDS
jgi:hypothetical protein